MGDFLFGGSKSESSSQSQYTSRAKSVERSKTIDVTPDQYKALRDPVSAALAALTSGNRAGLDKILSGFSNPNGGGPLAAPITANEQAVLDQLNRDTGDNTLRRQLIDKTLRGEFLPGQPGANPFLDATIRSAQRPTLQGLQETLERSLPGRFTAEGGQFVQPRGSSAFDRAAALATRSASDTLGDIATNLSYQTYDAERNRQQEAITFSQAEVDTVLKNLEAQALPRLIQDQGIERGLELYQTKMQALLQALSLAIDASLQYGTKSKGKSKSKAQGTSESSSNSHQQNGAFGALFGGL